MSPTQLMAYFDRIAEAPGAVPRLRRFIISLAVRGKLVAQDVRPQESDSRGTDVRRGAGRFTDSRAVRAAEEPYDLPNSWRWTAVQDVCEEVVDCPHSTPLFMPQGILCLDTNSFKQGALLTHKLRYVSPETYRERVRRLVPRAGDVVFGREGTVGESIVVPSDLQCCLGQRVMLFRSSRAFIPSFLSLSLSESSSLSRLMLVHKGIGAKHVNVADMRRARIALPPVEEQSRILTKVDELMALCDRLEAAQAEREGRRDRVAMASLARLNTLNPDRQDVKNDSRFLTRNFARFTTRPEHISALRRAALALAASGKLVEQNPSDEPAAKLLGRIKDRKVGIGSRLRPVTPSGPSDNQKLIYEVPSGWAATTLGDVLLELQTGPFGSSLHQSDYRIGGTPVINPASIKGEKLSPLEKMAVGPETLRRLATFKLRAGDIVMARRGELGRCAVVTQREDGWLCGTGSLILRLPPDVYARFMVLLIGSPSARQYLADTAVGATMQNLNQSILLALPIGLPPLLEQQRIVNRVDDLMAMYDRLEAQLAAAQAESSRLLEVVLHKALEEVAVGTYQPVVH